MPQFRIPFTSKKPSNAGNENPSDENANPAITRLYKPSLALGTKERPAEPNEFKMSSVNDNGEYMPPSPIEQKSDSYWGLRSPTTTNSSYQRSAISDNEPFSISRESFDSYRRSFDISGRSPIVHSDSYTSRTSLDSRHFRLPPRSSVSNDTFARPAPIDNEEGFEDVKLQDDTSHKPKRKSFLSRFGENTDESNTTNADGKHHFSILPGRRRGQSGTGSELESVQRPDSKGKNER